MIRLSYPSGLSRSRGILTSVDVYVSNRYLWKLLREVGTSRGQPPSNGYPSLVDLHVTSILPVIAFQITKVSPSLLERRVRRRHQRPRLRLLLHVPLRIEFVKEIINAKPSGFPRSLEVPAKTPRMTHVSAALARPFDFSCFHLQCVVAAVDPFVDGFTQDRRSPKMESTLRLGSVLVLVPTPVFFHLNARPRARPVGDIRVSGNAVPPGIGVVW